MTPKKQMNYLATEFEQYTPQFDLIKFGELEDVICIDGEPVEPDQDGYYHINKNCSVKTYVCDGEYGSGIARFELWLGEPDDTPEKQGEEDNTGTRLYKNNEKHELYNWYNFDWDISDVKSGDYKVYAKAFDQAGNTKETYINVKIEAAGAIHNCLELQAMKDNLSGNYWLANDIDCTYCTQDPGGALYNGGQGFDPIYFFTGTFDGKGHTITGLKINRSVAYVGLFGRPTNTSEIKNVGLIDVNITGLTYTGGLVGTLGGKLKNCYTTGSVTGGGEVGGLVGRNWSSEDIENCYSECNVYGGGSVGGLVGMHITGKITSCYATGNVSSAGGEIGGLVGTNWRYCPITNCYATGAVSGNSKLGGLIGSLCYDNTLEKCYSTGHVSGNQYVGGLIGLNYWNCPVNDSFWDTQISGTSYSPGGIGKTTVEMKLKATYTDWDFSSIWDIIEGDGINPETGTYPWLR
ncbi:MAG: GLUG motif-containing protein [bacterium]|nr:GLUG motif-containing protein [bacterium]